ncbi:MAG: hypothetical protein M3010_07380 [Candidatus Dormibacteraeota bacterium]|nr:hypothetical protein [Candidatus Dormibacteraeota bacterium]
MLSKRRFRAAIFVVVVAAAAAAPWPALADPVPAGPTVVSVASPFAPLDCGLAAFNRAIRGDNQPEEPVIAVNPSNPRNIVVAYIVDTYLSNLVRTSLDGGQTWRTVKVPGISLCTDGAAALAADPSLVQSDNGPG